MLSSVNWGDLLWKSFMGILIMAMCLSVIDSEFHFAKVSDVISLKETLFNLPPDSLIFLDIDDTIITPASQTFRVAPYKRIVDEIKARKEKYNNYQEIVSNWRLKRKVMLVDSYWPNFIMSLKEKFPVYGLTKMDVGHFGNIPSMEEWRYNELKGLGIEFTNNDDIVSQAAPNPVLYKGILMTGRYSKSEAFKAYLSYFKGYSTIVFIDDRFDYLSDMENFCKKNGFNFIGILFEGVQNLGGTPDPKVVEFQKKNLIENATWYEDEEAARLLQKNAS